MGCIGTIRLCVPLLLPIFRDIGSKAVVIHLTRVPSKHSAKCGFGKWFFRSLEVSLTAEEISAQSRNTAAVANDRVVRSNLNNSCSRTSLALVRGCRFCTPYLPDGPDEIASCVGTISEPFNIISQRTTWISRKRRMRSPSSV